MGLKGHDLVQGLMDEIEGRGDDFTPHLAAELVRSRLDDKHPGSAPTHILCDLIDGLWDEVQRLRTVLDQSKGKPK